jgi:hypothetical protein
MMAKNIRLCLRELFSCLEKQHKTHITRKKDFSGKTETRCTSGAVP